MKCPRCKNSILQKGETVTRVRIKHPLLVSKSGVCTAKCFWCGERIVLPFEMRKAEKFVLRP